jgi:hypothetical protein
MNARRYVSTPPYLQCREIKEVVGLEFDEQNGYFYFPDKTTPVWNGVRRCSRKRNLARPLHWRRSD